MTKFYGKRAEELEKRFTKLVADLHRTKKAPYGQWIDSLPDDSKKLLIFIWRNIEINTSQAGLARLIVSRQYTYHNFQELEK